MWTKRRRRAWPLRPVWRSWPRTQPACETGRSCRHVDEAVGSVAVPFTQSPIQ